MPASLMSPYMRAIRAKLGNDLLIVPSVTVLTFDEQDRVLLVRHTEGDVWVTPGGAIEPYESPAVSAMREMREETGLGVELVRLLGVYTGPEFEVTYANGDRTSYVVTAFEAEPRTGTPRPDGVETLEVRYLSRTDLDSVTLGLWVPIVLEAAYELRARPDRSAGWN